MRRRVGWLAALAAACFTGQITGQSAQASEGASSYYFPGAFGSFLVSVPPEPGFSIANQALLFGGNAQRAVINGRSTVGLQAFAFYNFMAANYTFEQPILGARLQIGAAVPFLSYANMGVSLQTQRFGTFSGGASDVGVGDALLNPFNLFWNFGDFNVKISQFVVAPIGHYDTNNVINVGRNYWAFDTQIGLTYFHKATGTEVSVLPGLMINATNPATDYRTGTEFHLDFMVNQFVMPTMAIGLQGYWYKQIDGDSGSGAVLGPFMGESLGLGPAVLWVPESTKGKFSVVFKWLHDISNTNRLNGDWGQVAASWKF